MKPRLAALAWPIFVELLLGIAVGFVGTVFAARLSDASAAGFALAHHVFAALFILFRVIGAGVGVVVTQALGAGRRDAADATARAAVGASSWLGAGLALPAALVATPLLRLLSAPPEVLPIAAVLLVALAPAMLLDAWNATLAAVLRAHLRTREVLVVMVVMHALHLVLLWPLMFGLHGRPGLGLAGYALALVAARLLGLALHLLLLRRQLGLKVCRGDWWRLPRTELAAIARFGLPGAAENLGYRLAFMVSVAVAGTLGTQALATQAYTIQVSLAALLFGVATGLAVELLVGHHVGAGELRAAHRLVRRSLGFALPVSVGATTLVALAAPALLHLFTGDAAIVREATRLLWWTVLLEPGRTFNVIVINALRAAGDARYPVQIGAGSMLVVLAGGSWWLGSDSGLGLGLTGVWIAYVADEWLRGLLMWRRWQRLAWVPPARQLRRQLRLAQQGRGVKYS